MPYDRILIPCGPLGQAKVEQIVQGPLDQSDMKEEGEFKAYHRSLFKGKDKKVQDWVDTRLSFADVKWRAMSSRAPGTFRELLRPRVFQALDQEELEHGAFYWWAETVIHYPPGLAETIGRTTGSFWKPEHIWLDVRKWLTRFPTWLDRWEDKDG